MKKEKYLSAVFAFFMWGSWSYFVNINDENRFISSFFQGLASFLITLFMVRIIIIFNNLFKNSLFFLTAILTVSLSSSLVLLGHILIKTQNIFYTLLPTIIVSLIFAIFMARKVSKI